MTGNLPEWVRWAKVGDRVVCVELPDFNYSTDDPIHGLELHKVYTIEEIEISSYDLEPEFGVGTYGENGLKCMITWRVFRPVNSTETGMEILKSILNKTPTKAKEPA